MLRIIEVGPRDGLQNEPTPIPTDVKLAFIRRLADAGLREIEATSFVSPKWVPQLGDAAELWPSLASIPGVMFSALVPNVRGLERAIELGVGRIAVFTAASDAFTQKNINMTVEESLEVFKQVVGTFRHATLSNRQSTIDNQESKWVRGYVSTAFECPYSGPVDPARVVEVAQQLLDMGVDEISIGDTIGVAVPNEVRDLTKRLLDTVPAGMLAYHFHDTRGTAIANVDAAYEMGVTAFDSSAAGLGGCPYAPGAGGNLSTDDLVYFFERSGIASGVDRQKLAEASLPVLEHLGRRPASKAQVAALAASAPK